MKIRYPISIKLNITRKCNLRCNHCFINEYQEEMPIEHIFDLIDDFHKNKLPILFLTGGEPFVHNDLIDILTYLKNTSINVNLATNGTLINESLGKQLADLNINSIQVSIDGHDEVYNDHIRGEGAFAKAIYGIKILLANDINVTIAHVINKKNLKYIDEMIQLCVNLEVRKIRFELYLPINTDVKNDDLALSSLDIKQIHTCLEKVESKYSNVDIVFPVFNSDYSCGAGVFNAVINPDMTMSPCDLLCEDIYSEKISNDNNVSFIWNSSEIFKTWRETEVKTINNDCDNCKNQLLCGMGCRASAKAYKGNLWEDDPICMTKYIRRGD